MKGSKEIIEILNTVLTGELTAINQYFLHSRICESKGYLSLAKKIWEESLEEMHHAKSITDRILFLEGLPNLQRLGKLEVGEHVHEILKSDLGLEHRNIPEVRKGIELCLKSGDHVSRALLEAILADEEKHVDWLEAQLGIIEDIGIERYLSENISS